MSKPLAEINKIQNQMNQAVLGQEEVVEKMLIGLLCNGNLLLEGFPGTAKTRAVRVLADCLQASMGRIQFTPDLLPADVVGAEVYHAEAEIQSAAPKLVFEKGPIFANLVLADEINRAPAKVQSALLEAMQERQVTVAGTSYQLPELFMVLATQNPIEQEGTYPLPEAQLDRFLLKVRVDYPNDESELAVMRLVRAEEQKGSASASEDLAKVDQSYVHAARQEVQAVYVSENVEQYMVALVLATRHPQRYTGSELADWIALGSSSRASISLDRAARAHAWLHGRDYVDPDDVRSVASAVLSHRIHRSYQALAAGVSAETIVQELINQVAVA